VSALESDGEVARRRVSTQYEGAMNCSSNTTESGPSLETGESRNCGLALMIYPRGRTGAA
jgi:hypothetical protein